LAERASVPVGGSLMLTDRSDRIVAHRAEPGRIGRTPEAAIADDTFTHRRPATGGGNGWTVTATVPTETLAESRTGALVSVAVAGMLSLLLGVGLALATARRVTVPLRLLARAEPLQGRTLVREIAALDTALREAGAQGERAREALERAHQAAEQANRGKDEFLAMLSHELRNPLGAIAAAVEVLNRTQGRGDLAASARRVIERQTRHMAQLMNDLQDVSRASRGKLALETRRIELSQIVWRAIEALRLAGRFKHHVLTVDLQTAWLEADPVRMEQVVSNLLTNAARYTPADGSIRVTLRADGHRIVLRVSDNGMGIPEGMLSHVFDLFVQGDRSAERRHAGMGLGLALVRQLVERHGGSVEAASDGANRGSTFTVLLPGEPPSPSGATPERHAVIVGPADQALADTAGLLGAAGCRITMAAELPLATGAILADKPDLVVVDLSTPGIAALLSEVRTAGLHSAIVGVAGEHLPSHAGACDAVLHPPLDPETLLAFIAAGQDRAAVA
jgi:signal transduction histidine kinase